MNGFTRSISPKKLEMKQYSTEMDPTFNPSIDMKNQKYKSHQAVFDEIKKNKQTIRFFDSEEKEKNAIKAEEWAIVMNRNPKDVYFCK